MVRYSEVLEKSGEDRLEDSRPERHYATEKETPGDSRADQEQHDATEKSALGDRQAERHAIGWPLPGRSDARQLADLGEKLGYFLQRNDFKVFTFTSCRRGEGVSTVVSSLAKFMVLRNYVKRALVIDCNLEYPVLHALFNVPRGKGLYEVLQGKSEYDESIHRIHSNGLHVMPSGKKPRDVVWWGENGRFNQILSTMKHQYDCILIDAPALLVSPDSLSLAKASDTTFLVIQANKTQWEVAERAKTHLQEHECHIGGVILNRVLRVIPRWVYKNL